MKTIYNDNFFELKEGFNAGEYILINKLEHMVYLIEVLNDVTEPTDILQGNYKIIKPLW